MRLQSGIRTAFGDHALAHIADRVDIEMRRRSDQRVRPVVAAQGDLLAGCEFQRAVRAEVNQHIGTESVARPKIRGYIGVRRCGIRAVYDGEIVVARTCGQLRQQHDITQLHTGQRQSAVVGGNIGAGELAVECRDLRHALGTDRCGRPRGVLFGRDEFGVAVFQKVGPGAACISIEYGALTLDQLLQLGRRGGQMLYAVTLALHTHQQVVERRGDLHAGCGQRSLAGTFVVIDSHPLLAVGLASQSDMVIDGLDERRQPFGHGVCLLQPLRIEAVAEERIGPDGSVDFGHDDALRQEAAVHAHLVRLPLVDRPVDVQRGEQRNVALREVVHHVVTHAAVRHVDYGGRAYRIGLTAPHSGLHVADAIDPIARPFQRSDQLLRLAHLTRDDDAGRLFAPQTVFAQKRIVFGDAAEIRLLVFGVVRVDVVEPLLLPFDGGVGLVAVEGLAVDRAADEGEHIAVVAASAAVQIAFDGGNGRRIRRYDCVSGIGCHCGDYGKSVVGGPLYGGPLLGRDTQSHTVYQHQVVFTDVVQLFRVEHRKADAGVVVRLGDLPQRNDLIIYKSDARGGEPNVPSHDTGCDNEQGDNPCPDFSFSFHIVVSIFS